MISIVISEKGGAERREVFHQDEITVGRVKGNDVLLVKGNVSKQHARVIVRDGRYIVSDLKSTNGTYVNHRRITHATLVREGDRIYIGDFIIRIEDPLARSTGPADATGAHPHFAEGSDVPPEDAANDGRSEVQSGGVAADSLSSTSSARGASSDDGRSVEREPVDDVVSHFPLEHDPDADDLGSSMDAPSGDPRDRVPQRRRTRSSFPEGMDSARVDLDAPTAATSSRRAHGFAENAQAGSLPHSSEPTPSGRTSQLVVDEARRLRFRGLVGEFVAHVEEKASADLDVLPRPTEEAAERVEQLLGEAVNSSNASDLELEHVVATAREELLGLGPLGAFLADDSVQRVRVAQLDVHVQRRSQSSVVDQIGFCTAASVVRVVRRMCADTGQPLDPEESVVERDLSGDLKLSAVLPPAALDGPIVQIRRNRSEPMTMNQLVRLGTLSRGMAMLLSHAMTAKANILVIGPTDQGGLDVLSALTSAAPRSHQLLALTDAELGGRAVRLATPTTDEKLSDSLRAATRMAPDHLVCGPLSAGPLLTLLDAIADGQNGVVLANPSGTLRQALDRLSADVAASRSMDGGTARDWISAAFELAVEVGRLRDGRVRVLRVAELKGDAPRDIFTFHFHRTATGGSVEGSFAATGLIPRVVEDLAARGLALDTAIFRRHPSS